MWDVLRNRKDERTVAKRLYTQIAEHARNRAFFSRFGVPDTVDGRFDLICLHAALVMDRFWREGSQGRRKAQALFDAMFREMDYALREMGVGDLSVPRHMKKMMKGFNGRAMSYRRALDVREPEALVMALLRNLYGDAPDASRESVRLMAHYVRRLEAAVARQEFANPAADALTFPDPEHDDEQEQIPDARMVA